MREEDRERHRQPRWLLRVRAAMSLWESVYHLCERTCEKSQLKKKVVVLGVVPAYKEAEPSLDHMVRPCLQTQGYYCGSHFQRLQ